MMMDMLSVMAVVAVTVSLVTLVLMFLISIKRLKRIPPLFKGVHLETFPKEKSQKKHVSFSPIPLGDTMITTATLPNSKTITVVSLDKNYDFLNTISER
jgi:hypothetical protein